MELPISVAATGALIVLTAVWRARNIRSYRKFQENLEMTVDVANLDLSGQTEYTNCYSHQWVIENMYLKKHSRIGRSFQEQLMEDTLVTVLWFGLALGLVSMFIGVFLISSLLVVGSAVGVFAAGALIIVGPGSPRDSEELLAALIEVGPSQLCREDYPYVRIAVASMVRWTVFTFTIGIAFLMVSPWADMFPEIVALVISAFTENLLYTPALILSEIWVPLAFVYMATAIPLFLVIVPKIVLDVLKRMRAKRSARLL